MVADSGNGRIERFKGQQRLADHHITSYGTTGTGTGQLQMPTGVDTAADGTIWIADTKNNRIVSYKPSTGAGHADHQTPAGSTRPFAVPWASPWLPTATSGSPTPDVSGWCGCRPAAR